MGISKERRQIEIPAFIPWNFMDAIGAVIDNDRIDDCVWIYVWKSGSNVPGLYFDGAVIIQLFSSATSGAMKSIRGNAGMIKKVYVPKYIYPLSSVLFNYIIFMLSLVVLVVVAIVLKVYPTIYLVQALIPLALILITAFGVGMILSTMAVFFRDLEYLWTVALMLIMYSSAIFYPAERLLNKPGIYGYVLKANPLYLLIHNFRQAVYGRPMNMKFLAVSAIFAVVSVVVGLIFFYKKQDEFILHI